MNVNEMASKNVDFVSRLSVENSWKFCHAKSYEIYKKNFIMGP